MATFYQNDLQMIFVGAAATATTGTLQADTMNSGEIGIFTPDGRRMTEALAATEAEFVIVLDRGTSDPIVSPIIKKADLVSTRCNRLVYSADVQQVEHFGYNGTSGSFEEINDNLYHLRINIRQGLSSNHGGLYIKHATYTSDATAAQEEIAAGLHKSLSDNFSKEDARQIVAERIYSAALAAPGGGETYSINQGSVWAVASGAPSVAVGEALRFGGTPGTDPVYIVVEVSGNNVKIDVPFQGADVTGQAVEQGDASTGDWGIRLTGQQLPFSLGKIHDDLVMWKSTTENFGTTTFTATTAPSKGTGTERQVQELEWSIQNSTENVMGEPFIFPLRADATGNYDLIHLREVNKSDFSLTTHHYKKTFTLAIPETAPNYAIAATANDITDVLEVLVFGAAGGEFAVT